MGCTRRSECMGRIGRFAPKLRHFGPSWARMALLMQLCVFRGERIGDGVQIGVRHRGSGCVRLGVPGIQMSMNRGVIQPGGPLQSMDDAFVQPQFRGSWYEEERSVCNRAKDSCVTRRDAAAKIVGKPARFVRAKSFTLISARLPRHAERKTCSATRTLA